MPPPVCAHGSVAPHAPGPDRHNVVADAILSALPAANLCVLLDFIIVTEVELGGGAHGYVYHSPVQ